ncbi:TCR/Tet family MFS transporter [Leptospira sarikeiensis]|uniref:MFS transporter n=1 Tax=Leptospira sarikeiensis TaxID=2484943 RepID=A0A4R9K5Y8_9LEPT|nr:TCR/Tet family MFS transporter [Leptospira sarikeiensis]TGL60631.1 MFS transporter [Leptospira sarikeiensis]
MTVQKKSALQFLLFTLLIDFIGFGIIIPVVPNLLKEMLNGDLSTASVYGGLLSFAYAITQFFCAPIIGGLSDRFGRRPVLLASLFGLGVDYAFLAFAPNVFWLFVGRIIAGITGASYGVAGSIIADISPPEKRSQNLGLVGMAFGMGFIIGPIIGGLFSEFGPRAPFWVASSLSLLNWIYGYFVLPETLLEENKRKFNWIMANPFGSIIGLIRYPGPLSGLVLSLFLIFVANHCMETSWSYFTMNKFQWTATKIGFSLAVVGASLAAVQGGLLRIIIPKLGQKNSAYLGILARVGISSLFAFAWEEWMLYVLLVPFSLCFIATPAIQGYISNHVSASQQGEFQGIMGSMMSLSAITGPLLMSSVFAYFTREGASPYFPGAPFIVSSILAALSLVIAIISFRKEKLRVGEKSGE